jgi:phospholipase/carboxylesterase
MVLVAPDARERTWDRANSGVFGPDVRFLDSCLRWVFERCAIDERRIALMGFSDGASYALSLGPSNGDLITHVNAFSPGFSDPEEPIVGRPRIFVSHGSRDGVLPVGVTRDGLVPMFEMDGYDVRYDEFDGAHEMPDAVVDAALEWFLG